MNIIKGYMAGSIGFDQVVNHYQTDGDVSDLAELLGYEEHRGTALSILEEIGDRADGIWRIALDHVCDGDIDTAYKAASLISRILCGSPAVGLAYPSQVEIGRRKDSCKSILYSSYPAANVVPASVRYHTSWLFFVCGGDRSALARSGRRHR